MRRYLLSSLPLVLVSATAASAHPGDHARHTLVEAIAHLAAPDHLAGLGFAVLAAGAIWRWMRLARAPAKSTASRRGGHDGRAS